MQPQRALALLFDTIHSLVDVAYLLFDKGDAQEKHDHVICSDLRTGISFFSGVAHGSRESNTEISSYCLWGFLQASLF